MRLMDAMMERMINSMTVEERAEMMLEMMPSMMEGIEIDKVMPDMMNAMGRFITLTGIAIFIGKATNDDELKEELTELLTVLKEKMPELAQMMQDMMPVMGSLMLDVGVMDGMMDLMGKMMPVMVPMMGEMMPIMMKDRMPELMAEHENVRQMMPAMMMEIMPDCIDAMLPTVGPEGRTAFLSHLAEAMGRAAGREGMATEDSQNLEEEIVRRIRAGSRSRLKD